MQSVGLAAKQPLKRRCSILLHRGQHVRIRVEGDADRRVTQHLTDDLGMHASKEKERCAGVPQVMEADLWQISSPECSLGVVIRHPAIVERAAARARKDEVLVAPVRERGVQQVAVSGVPAAPPPPVQTGLHAGGCWLSWDL